MTLLHNEFPCCGRAANIMTMKPKRRVCKHCASYGKYAKGIPYMVTIEKATDHAIEITGDDQLYAARWEKLEE